MSRSLNVKIKVNETNFLCAERHYLPPASEGWGKVMFSVCSHLGGYPYPIMPWGTHLGGGTLPGPAGGGYPARSSPGYPAGGYQVGYPPGQVRTGGYPVRTTEAVLTTRRAVCLLRSRRRTFLLINIFVVPCCRSNLFGLVGHQFGLNVKKYDGCLQNNFAPICFEGKISGNG